MQFIPTLPHPNRPLARYLPPVGDAVGVLWLERVAVRPPAWVLDPFGVAPWATAALARAGYTVLVVAFNPILRFLATVAAQPPAREDLQAALAALSAAKKGSERVQPHIEALYRTTCRACGSEITADAFIWERDGGAPARVRYSCPRCHENGDHPADEADSARAMRFADAEMHRARALERIAPMNDPDRPHAARALKVYPPRAVYALGTLINKRPLLDLSPERRRALDALFLSVLDAGNALWPLSGSPRPRQLHVPTRYLENNLWAAMEAAVDAWAADLPAVPLYRWPDRPAEGGGVVLFAGRLRDLAPRLADLPIQAVCAVVPRPHPAFWALSALWSGWLWGPQAVAEFKPVLRRRRYDWGWHTAALQAAFTHLHRHLPTGLPCLTVLPEVEPGFLTASVLGLHRAGFQSAGAALRLDPPEAHLHWRTGAPATEPAGTFTQTASNAVQNALRQANQPLPFLALQAAALIEGGQSLPREERPVQAYTQTRRALIRAMSAEGGLVRYGSRSDALESDLLWLREGEEVSHEPWFDRVERALVALLLRQPGGTTLEALEQSLCEDFPGLLTPPRSLVRACLASYASSLPGQPERYRLRDEDAPSRRRRELADIRRQLETMGKRLAFRVLDGDPLRWVNADNAPVFTFHIQASALLGRPLLGTAPPTEHPIIVLPGGRAGLVRFKLERDPRLNAIVEARGWRFMKFRLVRRLSEVDSLRAEALLEWLDLDPLTHNDPQIPLM